MIGTRRIVQRLIVCALAVAPIVMRSAEQGLPRGDAGAEGLDPAKLREATALLEQFVADRKIAGAVAAVSRNGRVVFLESVGVQDLESRAPMTPASLFRIYSMTKPVTAVAVMMLFEAGKFKLEDPVAKYLPAFDRVTIGGAPGHTPRRPSRAMTVQDLLLHTSGLSHRTSDLYRAANVRSRSYSMDTFIDNITRAPLMEEPGTRFRYSEATTVLGRLVEVWSSQNFESFLNTNLFAPLKMNDTVFVVGPQRQARFTTAYAPAPGGGLRRTETEEVPFTERPKLLEGAVGLVSTVPDYLRFSQMLLNHGELDGIRILQRSTVERMTSNGLPASVMAARGGPMGWGLANVNVMMDKASPTYGEYGWDGTAGTIFWNDPARQLVTILMTQSVPANPDGLRQKFKAIVQSSIIR